MDDAILKLIEWIEAASPQLWAILIKQVYVEAWTYTAWGIVFAAMAAASARLSVWAKDDDDSWILLPLGVIAAIVCTLLSAYDFSTAIRTFVNPEFVAIKYILETLAR